MTRRHLLVQLSASYRSTICCWLSLYHFPLLTLKFVFKSTTRPLSLFYHRNQFQMYSSHHIKSISTRPQSPNLFYIQILCALDRLFWNRRGQPILFFWIDLLPAFSLLGLRIARKWDWFLSESLVRFLWWHWSIEKSSLIRRDNTRTASKIRPLRETKCQPWACRSTIWVSLEPYKWETQA